MPPPYPCRRSASAASACRPLVSLVGRCNAIVRAFHVSTILTRALALETGYRLVGSVVTRWGPAYDAISRMCALREAVTKVLRDHDRADLVPQAAEWAQLA